MPINLHLLRLFAAVAEHQSFSRAAGALYISQPAVSKAVRELERQTGAALLDRSRSPLALTEAGEILYRHAQQIFRTEHAAEIALAHLRELEQGRLAIGASTTIGAYLLPPILGAFHRRYPKIQLFLDIGHTRDILERLQSSPLDIALVEGPVEADGLEVAPWREDELVVIAASDSPLGRASKPSLKRILAAPFVHRESGSGTRQIIDEALRAKGITLPVTLEAADTETVKHLVSAGLGLGMVSAAAIAQEVELGRLIVLDAPELRVRRWLSRVQAPIRPVSSALRAFLTLLDAEV